MALAAAAALAALAAAGYVALPNEGRTLQAVPSSAVPSSAPAAPAKALDSVPCVTAIALTGSPNLPVLEAQLAQYGLADRYYPQVMEPDPDGKVAGIFTSHVIAYNRALSRGAHLDAQRRQRPLIIALPPPTLACARLHKQTTIAPLCLSLCFGVARSLAARFSTARALNQKRRAPAPPQAARRC